MNTGIFITLGIFVNCIWGTAFLIPHILPEVNPIIIAIGRYLVYGLVSVALIFSARERFQNLSKQQWLVAFSLGFAGNVGYYLFLSSSIYHSGITIAALVVGILPVALVIVGNLIEKTYLFRSLVLPVLFILSGMITLSLSNIETRIDNENILLGTGLAIVSLVLWTFYGIKNAQFLKLNPSVSSNSWSIAIGVCCLLQSLIILLILAMFTNALHFSNDMSSEQLWHFVLGCLFLGIVVSWLATILWNQASRHLPVALAGQLIVFETISSLVYGYVADQSLPNIGELLAVTLVVVGVIAGLRATQTASVTAHESAT